MKVTKRQLRQIISEAFAGFYEDEELNWQQDYAWGDFAKELDKLLRLSSARFFTTDAQYWAKDNPDAVSQATETLRAANQVLTAVKEVSKQFDDIAKKKRRE
jgi:hypothetical protein